MTWGAYIERLNSGLDLDPTQVQEVMSSCESVALQSIENVLSCILCYEKYDSCQLEETASRIPLSSALAWSPEAERRRKLRYHKLKKSLLNQKVTRVVLRFLGLGI